METSPVKNVPAHPKVSIMVGAAITALAERKGSSLSAIKKYMSVNYDVNVEKMLVYIKKYLKSAVESGEIIQTKGKGATGSFKMNKQKTKAEAPRVKSSKPLKMRTSTPKKPLKSKKASTPNTSPVKNASLNDAEEPPPDGIGTKSNKSKKIVKKPRVSVPTKKRKSKLSLPAKVKKPKKLMAKKVELKSPVSSPNGQSDSVAISSGNAKPKVKAKPTKEKKTVKTKKAAASIPKDAVSKKTAAAKEKK